ncbi:ATP-grasp fold amidoligase family protein [Vagococcus fluvialis]|uniref:ATP-grasp fold amidoligase family protein n=1 Tax=Vagococcus fluvialis TaxID=2738 RepID=UPI003B21203E
MKKELKTKIIMLCRWMLNDKVYLKLVFRLLMNQKLNLKEPKTFNEKIQYLKLYDRKEIYPILVDKYEVKDWVQNKIGSNYLIETLGIWNTFEEIDFESLPMQFVLKCTHDSGSVKIVKDKSKIDYNEFKEFFSSALKKNYFDIAREWAYKDIKPRIIAEKLLESEEEDLPDYKFHCFNGVVDSVMVCTERYTGTPKYYFFDEQWHLLKYNKLGIETEEPVNVEKPENIEKLFEIAKILSDNIPFVRVDLYYVKNQIYFGEMTFYPHSGFDRNLLTKTDLEWGRMITFEGEN